MPINDDGYLLKIELVGGGDVISTPEDGYLEKGTVVTLEAIANDGEVFIRWEGAATGSHHVCNFRINAPCKVTAVFSNVVPHMVRNNTLSRWIEDINSGTVIDNHTYLMWKKKPESELIPINKVFNTIDFAGYKDWRIPSADEMKFIQSKPSPLEKIKGFYWTSTKLEHSNQFDDSYKIINEYGDMRIYDPDASLNHLVRYVRDLTADWLAETKTANVNADKYPIGRVEPVAKTRADKGKEGLVAAPPPQPSPVATPPASSQSLLEVLAWLCTQNQVPLAVLRQKLLPLDLMPSAVIDDVNERAFDVAGEAALDEALDSITVQRGVLLQVLAAW